MTLPRRTAALVLAFVVLAVGVGWLRGWVWQAPVLVGFDLSAAHLPVSQGEGASWDVDLAGLGMAGIADDGRHRDRSRMVLLEDGVLMTPHASPADIAAGPGRFRHFGDRLQLSTTGGGNPLSNGHHYVVVAEIPADLAGTLDPSLSDEPWKLHIGWPTVAVYLTGLALVAVAVLLDRALVRRPPPRHFARALAALLFAAATLGVGLDAASHRRDVRINADTITFETPPGATSIRLPGYWAFGRAIVGPAWGAALSRDLLVDRIMPASQRSSPLHRVARAQAILDVIAAVAFGLALALIIPVPWAAALTALAGNFAVAGAWAGDASRVLFFCALLVLAVLAVRDLRRPDSSRLVLLRRFIGRVALAGAVLSLVQYGLPAELADWIISEGLALPLELLLLAAATAYVFRPHFGWLMAAALLAGALTLTRESDGYLWLVVLGLLPFEVQRRGWFGAALPAGAVAAAFVLTGVAPGIVQSKLQLFPTVSERHRLAYATIVADEGDQALMPDPAARRYLAEVVPRMAAARDSDPRFQGKLIGYFNEVAWNLVWPALHRSVDDVTPRQRPAEERAEAARISTAILAAKPGAYLRLVFSEFSDLLWGVRLAHTVPWLILAPLLVSGSIVAGRRHGYFAGLLTATLVAGMAIPFFASVPITRLLQPVEAIGLLALLVLAGAAEAPG